MNHIPQPKPVQLDYFDPNIVVGIVEESESLESAEKEGRKVKNNTHAHTCECYMQCIQETKGRSKSAANKSSQGENNQVETLAVVDHPVYLYSLLLMSQCRCCH